MHFITLTSPYPHDGSRAPFRVLASAETHAYVEVDAWLHTGEEGVQSLSFLSLDFPEDFIISWV